MNLLRSGWIAIASWVMLAEAQAFAGQDGAAIYEAECRSCHRKVVPAFPETVEAARAWLMAPGRPHRFVLDEPSLEALLEYWQQQEQMH